ncbi:hypothetical protein [Borrelia hermsii]|nr:hypothetical protein [Borrelia hermsii]UPA08415.1 hypothetical protein bhDAH_001075 [Borrelia hermsii DAH]
MNKNTVGKIKSVEKLASILKYFVFLRLDINPNIFLLNPSRFLFFLQVET